MGVPLPQADGTEVSADGCGGSTRISAEERRKAEKKATSILVQNDPPYR